MCWAVQEAARSGGEELLEESGGAQGATRAVGMWKGVAIRVADVSKRVVSGGGWWDVRVLWRVAGRGLRVDSHLSDA